MSAIGSIAVDDVVPTVPTTKKGTKPSATSCAIASANRSARMAKSSSTSTLRSCSSAKPATRIPLSTDECAWVEVYARSSGAARWPTARCRAATIEVNTADEALSSITPPPSFDEWKTRGSPHRSTSQSIMTVSTSVAAGLVAHSMPCTPKPALTSSPSTEGNDALAGK